MDVLDDLVVVFDTEGNMIEWNDAAVEVTGYSATEFERMSPDEFVRDSDQGTLMRVLDETLTTGNATAEVQLITSDGTHIDYEFKVNLLDRYNSDNEGPVLVTIGRDITELKRERDITLHRERVLRDMYEIISRRDLPFSEQVRHLLRLGRVELGVSYGALSHVTTDECIFEIVEGAGSLLEDGVAIPAEESYCELAVSDEQSLVMRDAECDSPAACGREAFTEHGISCYIGASVFVGEDVYGSFCFCSEVARREPFSDWEITLVDLMDRWVSYELERQRTKERLEQSNEQLEKFASVVSHDLRNPIAVLEGWLQMTVETGDLQHLEPCFEAVDRMDELIDDVLTLSQAGDAIDETEMVFLEQVARECWETVATKHAELHVETRVAVQADKTRLQQLFENLFRNAIEHSDGTVTVTVGAHDGGFYVEDNGPGISADIRGSVLESGFTTTEEGTGLGLAIVNDIATAHGWALNITESSTGGARFEFTPSQ